MLFTEIEALSTINDVDDEKVDELVESMLKNGWVGSPILIYGDGLLTGSHRFAALKKINKMIENDEIQEANVMDQDVADDVTEIVEEHIAQYEEENGWVPDIDFGNIGWLLEGSWVEKYSDEIAEW